MAINIKIGDKNPEGISLKLNIRKTISGDIQVCDHSDVDIVILPDKKKIIVFAKSSLNDEVYDTQDRFFNFLALKGVIKRESVQSGDVYGSMMAEYPDAVNDAYTTQLVVFNIGKFIEEEKPHMEMEAHFEEEFERSLTEPNEEIGRLKIELKKSLVLKEIADDTMMLERTKEVVQLLESFSKEPINEQMINHVIKIQSLIREIKT